MIGPTCLALPTLELSLFLLAEVIDESLALEELLSESESEFESESELSRGGEDDKEDCFRCADIPDGIFEEDEEEVDDCLAAETDAGRHSFANSNTRLKSLKAAFTGTPGAPEKKKIDAIFEKRSV